MAARRFHQKRKNRPAAIVLALVAAVVLALLLGGRVFIVRRISVQGNQLFTDRAIADQSGIDLGQSIFSVDQDAIYSAFVGNGDITLEGVAVHWPDTVELTVRERQGRAYISYLGTALLVDQDMVIMRQLSDLPADGMPVITGVTVTGCAVGQTVISNVAGQIQAASRVLQALWNCGLQQQVSELNLADLDNLYLITNSGMMVVLGDESAMADKLTWMQAVTQQLAAEGVTTGSLDVSSGTSAIYAP